jgi:regulatory protein
VRIVRLDPPRGRWGDQRVTFADGTRLRVRSADIAALGLAEGDEVGDDALATLRLQDAIAGARVFAYRLLAIRPRSRHEMLTRLQMRRVPPSATGQLLDELERDGLLDDARFARLWIDGRVAHRPAGAVRLRAELRRKGIDRRVIDDAVNDRLDPEDEAALALAAARTLARRYQTADRKTAYRRLAAALERRGFSTHVIISTLAQILGTPPDAAQP